MEAKAKPTPAVLKYEDEPPRTIGGSHNNMLSHECIGHPTRPALGMHADVHRYPKGGGSNINTHEFSEQAYYIIEGTGEARVGDDVIPATPGTLIFIPKHAPHCIRNTGDGELVLFFVSTNLGTKPPSEGKG